MHYLEWVTCTVEQGDGYTFCLGRSKDGSARYCYDSSGTQIKQDTILGDVDCSGRECYVGGFDLHAGSLHGVCETAAPTLDPTMHPTLDPAQPPSPSPENYVECPGFSFAQGTECNCDPEGDCVESADTWCGCEAAKECCKDSSTASPPTVCSQETRDAAQMWETLVGMLSRSLTLTSGGRRSLKDVNDVFEALMDSMHSGEILNVKY